MSRFISIPGVRPVQRDAAGPGYRGSLPDPRENPQFAEFFGSRSPTSHSSTGFEAGQMEHFRGDVCRVEGEERNAHTGEIEQWVQRSDETGSGSYKNVWEPDGPRGMVLKESRRVFE